MKTKTCSLMMRLLALVVAATILPSCLENESSSVLVPPVAPSGLSALPTADGSGVALAWTDNSSDETGFRIEAAHGPIAMDSDVTDTVVVPADSTAFTYPAEPARTYYFRIRAIAAGVESAPSNVVSATTPDVPPPPERFDALLGATGSDKFMNLLWDDCATETGYTIERSTNGGLWAPLTTVGQGVTSFTDPLTATDIEYAYRIRASNANGSGPWSPAVRAQARSTNWGILVSPPSGDIAWFTSLAVSPFGECKVSSYDATSGMLALSSADIGGVLSTVNVDPGFPATLGYTGTSIALDDFLQPHIVANDVYGHQLYHLTNVTGTWVATPLDQTSDTDRAIVRTDTQGTPHVIYQSSTGQIGLRYVRRTNPTWNAEWVTFDQTDHFAFVVDPAGVLHLSYRRAAGGGHELVYARRNEGNWSFETLPTAGSPEMCSIAIAPSGAVHIAYNSITTGGLHLLYNSAGGWTDEVVHRSPLARWGRYNSLSIDGNSGTLHLSYQESLYASLRYASRVPGGSWVYQHVDGSGDVGRFSSIGTDSSGRVFIAYGDATNGRVRLARTGP